MRRESEAIANSGTGYAERGVQLKGQPYERTKLARRGLAEHVVMNC
jgi:hypothetical protein